jgi:transcriptional regulator with XRE-family HTH domain
MPPAAARVDRAAGNARRRSNEHPESEVVLREALIARRKALGFTQASLAHAIGCDRSTINRWERRGDDIAAHHREPLAQQLGLSLIELARLLNGAAPHADDGWFSNFETLEKSSSLVRSWEPMLVPGLLQTQAYAASLLESDDLVTRRIDRQRMVTRPDEPVGLVAVLDESVLHRPIGGPAVLAGQLRHLVAAADRPNVNVHVLSLRAPARAIALGSLGAMVILGFPWPGGLVYLEHRGGATYLDSRQDLDTHIAAFDRLRDMALSSAESVRLIETRARELAT